MNRIITILVTIFILLLLYIWISHVWGSEKPRHPRQITDARENGMSGEAMADADTIYSTTPYDSSMAPVEVQGDEYATERKVKDEGEAVTTMKTEVKPEAEVKAKAKTEEKKPEPKKTSPAVSTTTTNKPATTTAKPETPPVSKSVSSTGGQHLVIAGNFTQLVNAQQRVKELKKAGFADAEVVNFDLSEYHTVCAGRFADVNEARKLVKKLKDYHKIDAYVRIGS